jgi:hypothetical protein
MVVRTLVPHRVDAVPLRIIPDDRADTPGSCYHIRHDGGAGAGWSGSKGMLSPQPDSEEQGSHLTPGNHYQIIQSFTDYYGSAFKQGEVLRFKEQHFLPYHGGHTIVFDERSLYLQEEENADILAHFSSYVMKVT